VTSLVLENSIVDVELIVQITCTNDVLMVLVLDLSIVEPNMEFLFVLMILYIVILLFLLLVISFAYIMENDCVLFSFLTKLSSKLWEIFVEMLDTIQAFLNYLKLVEMLSLTIVILLLVLLIADVVKTIKFDVKKAYYVPILKLNVDIPLVVFLSIFLVLVVIFFLVEMDLIVEMVFVFLTLMIVVLLEVHVLENSYVTVDNVLMFQVNVILPLVLLFLLVQMEEFNVLPIKIVLNKLLGVLLFLPVFANKDLFLILPIPLNV
jgi:hypothetical protein